jgi:PAS domain S-box-containing protein
LRVAANTLGAKIGRERARARLSEAQLRYGSLVETLPAVIYVDTCEEQGQPLYVSPQVEAILGYTVESWMSDPFLWEDNLHPKDRGRAVGNVRQHHATGDPLDHEYRLRGADGRWIWIRDQSVALHDDQGEPTYVQGVMFDVTQQKEAENQLREAEERFRAIVEHVPAAIYLDRADTSFETQYINPQIEALTGITPLEWISSPDAWLDALHPDDRDDLVTEYAAAIKAGRPWVGEYRMRTRDGRTIWVHDETTFVSSASGEQLLQGVIFDITEQKLAEQALRSSEQREREAAERLRALDEMKNTFLAAVSHELRSPLTSILGLALTLERVPELGDADRRDLLSRLSQNARKLDRLLRDLLDVDRLNRGIVAPQYHTIDVGALARRTLESLDALGDRDVTVEAQPVVISADAAKIERIVENLLMNADRHTEPDRHIWLRVLPWDNGVLIAVDDDGPGVPEESRRAIFEPFQRGGEAAGDAPGTGLGLSLVARFAELHGGRAWVEDRVEGGSSFRVFIPAPVEPAAAATPASRGAAGPQPTVAAEGR